MASKQTQSDVRTAAYFITKVKRQAVKISARVIEIANEIAEGDSTLVDDFRYKFSHNPSDSEDSDESSSSDSNEANESDESSESGESDSSKKSEVKSRRDSQKDKHATKERSEDQVVPSKEESKIILERAIFRLSKVPRRVVGDIENFERDILKGRDYISRNSDRYPFLSSVYTGDYFDLKGVEALQSLLWEMHPVRKTLDNEDKIVDYAFKNYESLYKESD